MSGARVVVVVVVYNAVSTYFISRHVSPMARRDYDTRMSWVANRQMVLLMAKWKLASLALGHLA